MKNIIRYTAYAVASLAMAATIVSCSDTDAEQDRGKAPVIKYARPCDVSLSDSMIVSAPLGARLAFVGDNLGDVQQVWFNDQKVKLNPNMVTSHTVIVDVPNVIPGEVTNMARFITSTGIETQYPFNVTVPAPRVTSMSCEYAHAGETVTIYGSYFADDPNVPLSVDFNGIPAKVNSVAQDAVEVVVPEGATEGPVKVTTIYGNNESSFNYLDTRGMMFDFDGLTGLGNHGWHARPIENDGTGISGNYMVLGDGATLLNAAADWNDNDFSFEYWPGTWNTPTDYSDGARLFDIVDFKDYNNMSLKFEICIPASGAWQAGAMQLIFAGTDKVTTGNGGTDIYGDAVAGPNNTFFQEGGWNRGLWIPWSETEAYHTDGKWVTVSLPIKDFVYDKDGKGASAFYASEKDFAAFQMYIWSGGKTGVDCTPLIKIDNIRVVKN